jgi:hypothetical protein
MSYHNNSSNRTNTNTNTTTNANANSTTSNTSIAVKTCTAISVNGYFPLYSTASCAQTHTGGDGTYHTHLLNSTTYYMPNGLGGPGSGLQFHGDYGVTTALTTVETKTEVRAILCNTVYYHLFSMCHTGIEPYTFPQGSVPTWQGSPNFVSEGSTSKNLSVNNADFYVSVGQPEIGESVGVTDNVGISCMIYVGYIPFPVVNVVEFTKSIISTSKFSDCATCVSLAVKGCTQLKAVNYNPNATIDDGGCTYSNLPCSGCCIDAQGNQYTPTQPCSCISGYTLYNSPCVVVSSSGGTGTTFSASTCVKCCYSKSKGIYKPSNEDCSCDKGDISSPCMEVEDSVDILECDNCCTNKSGRIFKAEYSNKYGCSCNSGSWSISCKGEETTINQLSDIEPHIVETIKVISDCVAKTCPEGQLFDTSVCGCVSTLVDTCNSRIDTGFNETLSRLSITNHLDSIYGLSNGYNSNWSGYKFKHYANTEPTDTKNLCVAIEAGGKIQNGYWAYVNSLHVTYTPEETDREIQQIKVNTLSDLHSWTANTLSVELDKTKGLWEAMQVWNNDTTVWTPGLFSIEYDVVYCDCYDSGVLPSLQKPITPTHSSVKQVFAGEEGVYVDKSDNLVNYKCVAGTNPLTAEKQQTCQPTTDAVGEAGVFDNINACINSGCGGYMSCNAGVSVDGVNFDEEKVYTPIVMCCESLIKTSEEALTRGICQSECPAEETWYPLYNVFSPNLKFDSLLGYMVRDLLNKINNRECSASKDSREYKASGLVERLK